MIEITSYKSNQPNSALDRIGSRSLQMNSEIIERVSEIIEGVRAGGDEALVDYTQKFDQVSLKPSDIRVSEKFIHETAARADSRTVDAFRQAIGNIRAFHNHQRESGWHIQASDGARLGQRILPVASAGLYVPGGRAAYPSSVIMNTVPAQVAGVKRIAIVTPPGTLENTPEVAAVIAELGISEVYRVGGAQAIAALAFGTESIKPVDKIVGPGNIYVATAKKLVYGTVGIDSIAGPSEVIVLADLAADPRFVAADMLAQAEHDREASAICITPSEELAREVQSEVERQLETLERSETARASIESFGAIFIVENIEEGCELINRLAPEHLELMTADNQSAAKLIENAGAIFFGPYSPEPVGDYFAGPNHVLPTVSTARFSSPLGVYDFVKRQSVIEYTAEALEKNSDAIAAMADSEGLTAHKQSVLIRNDQRETMHKVADNTDSGFIVPSPSLRKIKPAVRAITAYTLAPYRATIKLNQNESPYEMPDEIKLEVERRLASRKWSRYPDFVPASLLNRLASFAGWKSEGTLAGNGSNELIQATLMVTVGAGSRVLIAEPTFTLYRQIVTVLGGEALSVPLTTDLQFDTEEIRKRAIEERADVVIICSPNNPTGCRIDEDDLVRLAKDFNGIVVVDEAYHEFSGKTVVPLLAELPNLIVLRTFSKAMAMAGLRVGYLLASPELAREVHKATLPYNLNFFSAMAAEVACEKYDLLKPQVEKSISERERLSDSLNSIRGIHPVRSWANFMVARTEIPVKKLFEELLARDILVRDVSRYPMLADYFRISVGTPEENDAALEALTDVMKREE